MMMLPRKRSDFNLWDQMFSDPFFTEERENKFMKTDIKEKKDKYCHYSGYYHRYRGSCCGSYVYAN